MKYLKILIATFIFSLNITYAQNTVVNRNPFVLKIPIDGKKYYKQEIKSSPYFIKGNDF